MAKNILNILKNVGIYIGVFLLAIAVCFGLLVLTAMIPKKCIEKNMQESAKFYRIDNGVEAKNGNAGTAIHYYADSTLLNIIYNIDSKKPVESVLWSKYYEIARDDTNRDFILTVTQ